MEDVNWLRFVFAFVFVLGLIGLFAVVLRKYGGRFAILPAGGNHRLKVTEVCAVGPKHRLVLVKRDQVEHLLLIGPESQQVVESGIRDGDSKAS